MHTRYTHSRDAWNHQLCPATPWVDLIVYVLSTYAFWGGMFSDWIWGGKDLEHRVEVWGGNSRSDILCMTKNAFPYLLSLMRAAVMRPASAEGREQEGWSTERRSCKCRQEQMNLYQIARRGNLVLNPSSDWQPVEGSGRRLCMDSPSPATEKTSCSVCTLCWEINTQAMWKPWLWAPTVMGPYLRTHSVNIWCQMGYDYTEAEAILTQLV